MSMSVTTCHLQNPKVVKYEILSRKLHVLVLSKMCFCTVGDGDYASCYSAIHQCFFFFFKIQHLSLNTHLRAFCKRGYVP